METINQGRGRDPRPLYALTGVSIPVSPVIIIACPPIVACSIVQRPA